MVASRLRWLLRSYVESCDHSGGEAGMLPISKTIMNVAQAA